MWKIWSLGQSLVSQETGLGHPEILFRDARMQKFGNHQSGVLMTIRFSFCHLNLLDADMCKGTTFHWAGGKHLPWLLQKISKDNENVNQHTFKVPALSFCQSVSLLYLDANQLV